MALKHALSAALLLAAIAATLGYLRDPPWLLSYAHGLGPWETTADGTAVRWTRGHASFFVPSDIRSVTLPLRSLKDGAADRPITAIITIDDRPVERVTLEDDAWRFIPIRLPPRGGRNVRRIDIKLDRVRLGGRGIQIGKVREQP